MGGDYESAASLADSSTIDPIFYIIGKFSMVFFDPLSVSSDPKPKRFVKASEVTKNIFLGISDNESMFSHVEISDSLSLAGASPTACLIQRNHYAFSSITGKHDLSSSNQKKSSSDKKDKSKVLDISILPMSKSLE